MVQAAVQFVHITLSVQHRHGTQANKSHVLCLALRQGGGSACCACAPRLMMHDTLPLNWLDTHTRHTRVFPQKHPRVLRRRLLATAARPQEEPHLLAPSPLLSLEAQMPQIILQHPAWASAAPPQAARQRHAQRPAPLRQ